MDKQEILKEINSVDNWFHKIELAPGIFTPGIQDTEGLLNNIRLPSDLTGKRVLDIGARDGLYSFECEKRGASEVIALDYTTSDTTGFNVAKKILGSNVKWITSNVYQIDQLNLGKFDLVLFLGVIYHLRHPYLAIDKIHDVLNLGGKVIVESHIIDGGFVDENGNWINLDELNSRLSKLNVAQIYEAGRLVNDNSNAWSPSIDTLIAMFKNSGFEIDFSWSYYFRGGLTATSVRLEPNHHRYLDSSDSVKLGSPGINLVPSTISNVELN